MSRNGGEYMLAEKEKRKRKRKKHTETKKPNTLNKIHSSTMHLIRHRFFSESDDLLRVYLKPQQRSEEKFACLWIPSIQINVWQCPCFSRWAPNTSGALHRHQKSGCVFPGWCHSVSHLTWFQCSSHNRDRDREATWRKEQAAGVGEKKVMPTAEAGEWAVLDELLGTWKPPWPLRNFTKILIFRHTQYTRHPWRSGYPPGSWQKGPCLPAGP